MAQIMSKALRKGADVERAIAAIRDENLSLQQERRELLKSYGLTEEVLEYQPACRLCSDTGYTKDGICHCLKEYYIRAQIAELSHLLDLGNQSFDTFEFHWYEAGVAKEGPVSALQNIERIYENCSNFAHKFGCHQDNLLLFGAPGLGKTFLSACIAREVSEKGYSVVYDTAGHIFSQFERQKFGRDDEEAESDVARVLSCDLLIMDDLGTELLTEFVRSALYQIINHRLQARKCTIISSNLTPKELGARYSPQIQSRLEGEYRKLAFFGEDIRQQKKKKK